MGAASRLLRGLLPLPPRASCRTASVRRPATTARKPTRRPPPVRLRLSASASDLAEFQAIAWMFRTLTTGGFIGMCRGEVANSLLPCLGLKTPRGPRSGGRRPVSERPAAV